MGNNILKIFFVFSFAFVLFLFVSTNVFGADDVTLQAPNEAKYGDKIWVRVDGPARDYDNRIELLVFQEGNSQAIACCIYCYGGGLTSWSREISLPRGGTNKITINAVLAKDHNTLYDEKTITLTGNPLPIRCYSPITQDDQGNTTSPHCPLFGYTTYCEYEAKLIACCANEQECAREQERYKNTGGESQGSQPKYCDEEKTQIDTGLGCIPIKDANQFITWFLRFAIGIGGGVAFLLMIFGAFQIITSTGDPERLKAGKELITSALIGLLMIIFSLFLLRLIGIEILHIPGLT